MTTIESALNETRAFPPSADTLNNANVSGMAANQAMCAEAEKDFERFSGKQARAEIKWTNPFTRILDQSNAPFFKWFDDGELDAPRTAPTVNCRPRPRRRRSSSRPTTARLRWSPTAASTIASASSPTA